MRRYERSKEVRCGFEKRNNCMQKNAQRLWKQGVSHFYNCQTLGAMVRPFKYSKVTSSGATIPARAPACT